MMDQFRSDVVQFVLIGLVLPAMLSISTLLIALLF